MEPSALISRTLLPSFLQLVPGPVSPDPPDDPAPAPAEGIEVILDDADDADDALEEDEVIVEPTTLG